MKPCNLDSNTLTTLLQNLAREDVRCEELVNFFEKLAPCAQRYADQLFAIFSKVAADNPMCAVGVLSEDSIACKLFKQLAQAAENGQYNWLLTYSISTPNKDNTACYNMLRFIQSHSGKGATVDEFAEALRGVVKAAGYVPGSVKEWYRSSGFPLTCCGRKFTLKDLFQKYVILYTDIVSYHGSCKPSTPSPDCAVSCPALVQKVESTLGDIPVDAVLKVAEALNDGKTVNILQRYRACKQLPSDVIELLRKGKLTLADCAKLSKYRQLLAVFSDGKRVVSACKLPDYLFSAAVCMARCLSRLQAAEKRVVEEALNVLGQLASNDQRSVIESSKGSAVDSSCAGSLLGALCTILKQRPNLPNADQVQKAIALVIRRCCGSDDEFQRKADEWLGKNVDCVRLFARLYPSVVLTCDENIEAATGEPQQPPPKESESVVSLLLEKLAELLDDPERFFVI